jgi:catechol 2,3-dioxygenase-like lactoylglutathione lyase family enzyme
MLRFGLMFAGICAFAAGLAAPAAAQGQTKTFAYDHIHLNVPDAAAAAAWYEKHFNGNRIAEMPNRIMFGSTRLMFLSPRGEVPPSRGGAIDHIGFSVENIEAKVKELEAGGATVEGPIRDLPGIFKIAFAVDPWGTRLEVVQDPELLGLHHLHLTAADPAEMYTWLTEKLGGERGRMKNKLEGVKYSAPGFSTVWILVTRGDAQPSQGRAIDHIGWRSTDMKADLELLRGKGATIQTEPRNMTLQNGPPINYFYVMGPNGTRVEMVERPGLEPGK